MVKKTPLTLSTNQWTKIAKVAIWTSITCSSLLSRQRRPDQVKQPSFQVKGRLSLPDGNNKRKHSFWTRKISILMRNYLIRPGEIDID